MPSLEELRADIEAAKAAGDVALLRQLLAITPDIELAPSQVFRQVTRGGLTFSVPEGATEEQIQKFVRLRQAPAAYRAPAERTPFEPTIIEQARAETTAAARARAAIELEAPMMDAEQRAGLEARMTAAELETIERQRSRAVQPGVPDPVAVVRQGFGDVLSAPFRPTRIRQLPVYRRLTEAERAGLTPAQVIERETAPPAAGEPTEQVGTERVYQQPDGTLRPPTTGELYVEMFAQQPLLTERTAREQAELTDERLAEVMRSERLPTLGELAASSTPALAARALLERIDEGRGITETPLGVVARTIGAGGSALAQEAIGYGLGPLSERTSPDPTPFDPEARRRASEDPDLAVRLAENIASGRTLGDELYDVPIIRGALGETGTYLLGTGMEILTPSPFTLAAGGLRLAGKVPAVAAAGQAAKAAAAAPITNPLRGVVARSIVQQSGLSDAKKAEIAASLPVSGSEDELVRAFAAAADDATLTDAFRRELRLRTPADLEMVSDTIAVPRAQAQQVRAAMQQGVRSQVARSAPEQAALLEDVAALARARDAGDATRLRFDVARRYLPDAPDAALDAQWQRVPPRLLQQADDVAARLADAPTPAATAAARGVLGRIEKAAGLDDGTLTSRLTAKAPAEASGLDAATLQALKPYRAWGDVPAELRAPALEQLRLKYARGAAQDVRRADDISSLHATIRSTNPLVDVVQRLGDSSATRWVRAVLGERADTVSVARAKEAIRGAAEGALKRAEAQIVAAAKETGSVDEAYNLFFSANMRGNLEEQWMEVLKHTYGREPALRVYELLAAQAKGGLPPLTVDGLVGVMRAVADARLAPHLPAPRKGARQALLYAALKKGVRDRLVKAGRDEDAQLLGELIDSRRPIWSVQTGLDMSADVAAGRRVRSYDRLASLGERKLAEASPALARMADETAPALRSSLLQMASDSASYLAGNARNALNSVRYGYVVPNLPYLVGRLASAPVISLATVGAGHTLRGLGRMGERATAALSGRRYGAGITTPEGLTYTPKQLGEMADQYGIGYSMLDSQRVGSLLDDIHREAQLAAAGQPGLAAANGLLNPTARSFYMRSAEAIEMSYRQSVFEGALAAGESPKAAAELARRSQLDYGAQPEIIRKQAARYLATASAQYGLLTELAAAAIRNPAAIGVATRTLREKQRLQDPYGLDGDAGLKALGIIRAGEGADAQRFYGPEVPIFAPLEQALGVLRWGNLLADDIRDAKGMLDASVQWSETGQLLAYETADELLPQVVRLIETAGADAGGGGVERVSPIDEQALFWSAAVAAHHHDPSGEQGIWHQFLRIARPAVVPPAPGAAHPVLQDFWIEQPPEGAPHVLWGRDEDGRPLYLVLEPSTAGLKNLALLRAATPDALERAFGAYAAIIDAPTYLRPPGTSMPAGSTPEKVLPGAAVPHGPAAAAAVLFGYRGGTADPIEARRQQIEQIRATRTPE